MTRQPLDAERRHLAGLLEAIQRCVYFLEASRARLHWPLRPEQLAQRHKDIGLFEAMAAMNERFAKLQDTLGAAMRHAFVLAGESGETFLKMLAFYEKIGVLQSATDWQLCRATRNIAARVYETDYGAIAEHFNTLHELTPLLYRTAARFADYCRDALSASPLTNDFATEFETITRQDLAPPDGQDQARAE